MKTPDPKNGGKEWIVPGLLFALLLVLFASALKAYDLWWHLKAGGLILEWGRVPTTDPFSYTAGGRPWIYHSWLGGVILHLVHAAGGQLGLIAAKATLISSALVLGWVAARKRGVEPALAVILVLAAAYQMRSRALTRPYLFSFPLFMVFYLILQGNQSAEAEGTRGGSRGCEMDWLWGPKGRLLLLPPLMILWANVHGGFLVGILMIGTYGVGEMLAVWGSERRASYLRSLFFDTPGLRFRALLLTGALTLAACIITPYGAGPLTYPFRLFSGVEAVHTIEEWRPMSWDLGFGPFWALFILAAVLFPRSLYLIYRHTKSRRAAGQICTDFLLMAGFGLMAIRSVRNLAWFVLLVAPVLGYHLRITRALFYEPPDPDDATRARIHRWSAGLIGLVLLVQHIGGGSFGFGISRSRLPIHACDYMEEVSVPERLYNIYEWGGYLIWRRWPEHRVFIDGRCLVYGDGLIKGARKIARGKEGWERLLQEYGVRTILISYRNTDSSHFFQSGNWRCIYWDDTALLALHRSAPLSDPDVPHATNLTNPVLFDEKIESEPPSRLLEELRTVLQLRPHCATAWAYRARALLKLAKENSDRRKALREEALKAALEGKRLRATIPEVWQALGECYRRTGQEHEAREAFERANALTP